MHTMKVHTKEDGDFNVHHNGDFSGDVIIQQPGMLDKGEIKLPFDVLKCVVAEYVRQRSISALEEATDEAVLFGYAAVDAEEGI